MSNKKQKSIKIATSAAVAASVLIPVATANAAIFTDVPDDHLFNTEIEYLKARNIIKGYEDGSFKPDNSFSRQEVVYLLGQYLQTKGYAAGADFLQNVRFKDVQDYPYELKRNASIVYDSGIFRGRGDGNLDPLTSITREESAAVMIRMLNTILGTDVYTYASNQADFASKTNFTDLSYANDYFHNDIKALKYFGITINTEFLPKQPIKRSEYSAFLYRAITKVLNNQTLLDEINDYNNPFTITLGTVNVGANGTLLNVTNARSGQKYEIHKGTTKIGEATIPLSGSADILLSPTVSNGDVLTIKISERSKSQNFTYNVTLVNPSDPLQDLVNRLEDLISRAEALDSTQYASYSWSNLQSVLTDAKAYVAARNYTTVELQNHITALSTALDSLVSKTDYEAVKLRLSQLIQQIYNLDLDTLDTQDKNELLDLLTAATALLTQSNVTIEQYRTMINELLSFIGRFNFTADKSALITLMTSASALRQVDHTPASWAPFATAYANGQAVLDDMDATTSEITSAVATLQAAMNGLVFNELTVPPIVQSLQLKMQQVNTDPTTLGGVMTTGAPRINFSTVALTLGQLADATVIGNVTSENSFTVPDNSSLSFNMRVTHSGVLSTGQLTMYVAKKQPNGQYKIVWQDGLNFFSLLGLPFQNKYDLSVNDLDGGEYALIASKTGTLNLNVISGDMIQIRDKVLIDGSSSVNSASTAVTTGISGQFRSSTGINGGQLSFVKKYGANNPATFTSTVQGKYGVLTVDRATGNYTYKSNGDPKSVGKVDSFEYQIVTNNRPENGVLHVQINPEGQLLNFNPQNPGADVSLVAVTNQPVKNVTVSPTSTVSTPYGNRTQTNTIDGIILTDFIKIESPLDILQFEKIKSGSAPRPVRYEILNEQGIVVTSKEYNFRSPSVLSGPLSHVTGLPVGNYKIRVTPLDQSVPYTFGLRDIEVKRHVWSSSMATGNLTTGNTIHPESYLYVNGQYVNVDGKIIEGEYGFIKVNKDGTYSYTAYVTADSNYPNKQLVNETFFGKSEEFKFDYIAPNGDKSSARIQINVNGTATPVAPPANSDLIPYTPASTAYAPTGDLVLTKFTAYEYTSSVTVG